MQRKRSELVPIAEAFSDLSGPVAAIRDVSPQALHHFTQADQVNQLVEASEADPDLGFMGRTMALCSLPRTNWASPKGRTDTATFRRATDEDLRESEGLSRPGAVG